MGANCYKLVTENKVRIYGSVYYIILLGYINNNNNNFEELDCVIARSK